MPSPQVPTFAPNPPNVAAALNTKLRDNFAALLSPPVFRARRTTALTIAAGHQDIPWNTIDEDTHTGWAAGLPTRYTIPAGWGGWWMVDGGVSLSGTGAAGLVLIPSVAVNGTSPTGLGTFGWEGICPFVPTGAAAETKYASSMWRVYANPGDYIEIDLWYSTESAITAVDITAGRECRIGCVWDGV
jgi:hypothetical protein